MTCAELRPLALFFLVAVPAPGLCPLALRDSLRVAARAEAAAVVVETADALGRPVEGLSVQGRLQRPATEAGALDLILTEAAPGRYEAPLAAILGAWDLTIQAKAAQGLDFQAKRRLTWR